MYLRKIKKTAQWILVSIIVIYVVRYFYDNTDDLRVLKEIQPIYLVWIFILQFTFFFIRAYRTQIILEFFAKKRIKYLSWFRIFILGTFLNKIAPQAGLIYRCIKLKELYGISYTQYIASFLFFTWFDTWVNFSIVTIVILTSDISMGLLGIQVNLLMPIITIAIFIGPFLASTLFNSITFPGKHLKRLNIKMQELLDKIIVAWKDKRILRRLIGWGLVAMVPKAGTVFVVFLALGQDLTFSVLIMVYALLQVSQLINITPGNLGVQEIVLGYVSEQAGVGMAEGIMASIILRMVAYIVMVSLGLLFGGWDLVRNLKTEELQ